MIQLPWGLIYWAPRKRILFNRLCGENEMDNSGLIGGTYPHTKPNQEIKILEGESVVRDKTGAYQGYADAYLKFIPFPCLVLEASVNGTAVNVLDIALRDDPMTVTIPAHNLKVVTHSIDTSERENRDLIFLPENSVVEFGRARSVDRVEFYVPNFPTTYGKNDKFIKASNSMQRVGIILLENDEWQVEMNSLMDLENPEKILKKENGFLLTHAGLLKKKSGQSFSLKRAREAMECLKYFLSFARGSFTGPILQTGYGKAGKFAWGCCNTHLYDSWKSVMGWFDYQHAEMLSSLFPGFCKKWNSDEWKDDVKLSLYWYLRSNTGSGGIEGSIILLQAALELISWSLMVNEKHSISDKGFRALSAADKISLLLSSIGIPLEVPESLPRLKQLTKKHNYSGPTVFVETRNSFVHSSDKRMRIKGLDIPLQDVFQLGLWYQELVFLHLFEYTGEYANRIRVERWKGVTEKLPWS